MSMPELTALHNAYQALQPLPHAARRRALQWLSDALVHGHTLPDSPEVEAAAPAVEPVAVAAAPARRLKSTTATAKRVAASAPASKARRGRRVKGGTSKATIDAARPYRRMPDPDTIMKAYRKVGTVSGLADRFEVPRHTVNHWARRLRSQGYDIGRAN
ncbi:MAG TPA: hypothetical protein VFC19_24185 [Candidatus Limnocylindrales bacterium]|nr:hypothetical protein [Candidatus Limnocylindrales bacterium]